MGQGRGAFHRCIDHDRAGALRLCGPAPAIGPAARHAAGVPDRAAAAAVDDLCAAFADRRLAADDVRHFRGLGHHRIVVLRAADRRAGQVADGGRAEGEGGDPARSDLPCARRRCRFRHRRNLVPGACADQIAELSRSAVLDVRRLSYRAARGLLPARCFVDPAVLCAGVAAVPFCSAASPEWSDTSC